MLELSKLELLQKRIGVGCSQCPAILASYSSSHDTHVCDEIKLDVLGLCQWIQSCRGMKQYRNEITTTTATGTAMMKTTRC